ncbi:MAG: hypothetical protein ACI9TP_002041, partial [Candidatus Azotimanducaceae bacterium]
MGYDSDRALARDLMASYRGEASLFTGL